MALRLWCTEPDGSRPELEPLSQEARFFAESLTNPYFSDAANAEALPRNAQNLTVRRGERSTAKKPAFRALPRHAAVLAPMAVPAVPRRISKPFRPMDRSHL